MSNIFFAASLKNGITDLSTDVTLMVFLGVLLVLTVFVSVWIIAANINKPEKATVGKMKIPAVIAIIVAVGAVIRLAFSLITKGYLGESATGGAGGMVEYNMLVYNTYQNGFSAAYALNKIYPLPYYAMLICTGLPKLLNQLGYNEITLLTQVCLRLPFIICDCIAAVVLYKIAKKYTNSYVGAAMAGIYMFCPIFFFSSSIWGSTFSMLSLFLLLSLYFMTQRNFLGLTASYSLALLTEKDAMYLLPVFACFTVYYFIKSLKAHRGGNHIDFKEWFKDKDRGLVLRLPLYVVCSLLVMYILQLPMLSTVNYSFFSWFYNLFLEPFVNIVYTSFNGLAIYNLFTRNNQMMGSEPPGYVYSILFFALVTALVLVVYLSKRNRANMVLIAAYAVFTLSIFYMGFSELNLVPFLVMLLLAFLLIKDKRILKVFGVMSLTVLLNACAVMMTAGYLSNAELRDFSSGYNGTALLSQTSFGGAINIICTVISMITFVYMTMVVLDISLSNVRKPFDVKSNTFGDFMRDWFKLRDAKIVQGAPTDNYVAPKS